MSLDQLQGVCPQCGADSEYPFFAVEHRGRCPLKTPGATREDRTARAGLERGSKTMTQAWTARIEAQVAAAIAAARRIGRGRSGPPVSACPFAVGSRLADEWWREVLRQWEALEEARRRMD